MQTASADKAIAAGLFRPVRLGSLELRNRIAMAPMSRYLCPDDVPHQGVVDYYRRRAEADVGLIITEGTYIGHPSAASYAGVPHFHGEALAGWARVLQAVHAAGGRIFPQLWHTGSFRQSWMGPVKGVPGFGPSENFNAFTMHPEPTRAMTEADVEEVIGAYARAAADAQALGFDGVELHAAHGYLIDEFLWDRTNRRTDRWGGDRRGRTRFAVEIVRAIRGRVGPDFPVSLRWSLWKQQDYQAKLADTPTQLAEILEPLVEAGVSILHTSTRRFWSPGFSDEGDLTLAGWTKKLTGLPVIMVGGAGLDRAGIDVVTQVASLDVLEKPLRGDEFDILAVGRALLADPEWARKVGEGRIGDCRPYSRDLLDSLG
ncbi:NADH:flavin oxidoreductase [Aquibium sp. ELW1220]|uniref:NADH:flavin oxidoreductase n=1 Tax=Aquibium sp. ELW1220 TaxID=2976766 RepID=UPI0025B08199|nr:NADH:flavin oxidoreductase [Aquibium sp. ELW1220]MDN2583322.1 NADH:flavin oxidoreductase [Aquibium sp. ELW1220]